MEFLKRVVPPVVSGDMVLGPVESFQESSPRLLKLKRLGLLSSEKTEDQEGGTHFCHSHYDKHQHQQVGKVKMCFQSFNKKYFRKVKLFLQVCILVSINLYLKIKFKY